MVRIIHIRLNYLILFFTGCILGFLLGVFSITMLVSYRIENYHQIIKQLESDVADKETRLKKLEESLNKVQQQKEKVLKDIVIELICNEDEIDKIVFIQSIKQKYNILLGKDIDKIDMDIIDQIIDKRIFKVGDKEYQLSVKKIVLTDILQLWIEAILKENNN